MLAEGRAIFELVGRTGPGGPTAHFLEPLHEEARQSGLLRIAPGEFGVEKVEGGDVQGGRHRDPGATPSQAIGKVECGHAREQAGVDVGPDDVQQAVGLHGLGDPGHHPHGQGNCRTLVSRQTCGVALVEAERQQLGLTSGSSGAGTSPSMTSS